MVEEFKVQVLQEKERKTSASATQHKVSQHAVCQSIHHDARRFTHNVILILCSTPNQHV